MLAKQAERRQGKHPVRLETGEVGEAARGAGTCFQARLESRASPENVRSHLWAKPTLFPLLRHIFQQPHVWPGGGFQEKTKQKTVPIFLCP